jgi:hypothetical protein
MSPAQLLPWADQPADVGAPRPFREPPVCAAEIRLATRLAMAQCRQIWPLAIYPDFGHGAMFDITAEFASIAIEFIDP